MKIKVEVKETKELEIELPAFLGHGFAKYKVTDTETIEVRNEQGRERCIRLGVPKLAYTDLVLSNGKAITEQEFNTAFVDAQEYINAASPPLAVFTGKTKK